MAEEKKLDVMKNEDKSQVLDVLNEDMKSKIGNAFNKIQNQDPTIGRGINFIGENQIVIYVNSYENYLHEEKRKRDAVSRIYFIIEGLLKTIKENLKSDGVSLTFKMLAENYDVECISMNNRHKITVRRVYNFS